jgi:hypothetical protein
MSLLASNTCSLHKIGVYLNTALWKVHAFLSTHYIVRIALHSREGRIGSLQTPRVNVRKFSVEYSAALSSRDKRRSRKSRR